MTNRKQICLCKSQGLLHSGRAGRVNIISRRKMGGGGDKTSSGLAASCWIFQWILALQILTVLWENLPLGSMYPELQTRGYHMPYSGAQQMLEVTVLMNMRVKKISSIWSQLSTILEFTLQPSVGQRLKPVLYADDCPLWKFSWVSSVWQCLSTICSKNLEY